MKKGFLTIIVFSCFIALFLAVSLCSSSGNEPCATAETVFCDFYDFNNVLVGREKLKNNHCAAPEHVPQHAPNLNYHYDFLQWESSEGITWSNDLVITQPTTFYAVYRETPHTFNRRDTGAQYFAQESNCIGASKYHYSCNCGMMSDNLFESGEYGDHLFSQSWVINSKSHWFRCVLCGEHKDFGNHSGGTPTETTKGFCEVCGSGYGEYLHYEITQLKSPNTDYTIPTEKRERIFGYFNSKYTANQQTYSRDTYLFNFKFNMLPNGIYKVYFSNGAVTQATAKDGTITFVSNQTGEFAIVGAKIITAGAVIMLVMICVIIAVLLGFFLVWVLNRQSRLAREESERQKTIDLPY